MGEHPWSAPEESPAGRGAGQARGARGAVGGCLLLVDGHGYAYRAFHAIRRLSAPDGRPTNAVFGFIKMLLRMRAVVNPTHLAVVWDGGLAAERTRVLPEYKAQRPEMPADLESQLDGMAEYLRAAGVPSLCVDGVEADDLIAVLTRQAEAAGMAVIIATSDKDFMQLVSERVGLLNPNDKSEAIGTEVLVREKTGLAPGQIVDWLSLIGDSVDNIPGVPGVGPKTATALLQQFGSVDELYRRLDEVTSERTRASLRSSESEVRRNRELIRLRSDLESPRSAADCVPGAVEADRLRELFRGWGFKTMLAELEAGAHQQPSLL